MPKYNISLRNESGSFQQYTLVSQVPEINGPIQGRVFTVALANTSVPPGGRASFEFDTSPVALTGRARGELQDDMPVNIMGQKPGTSFEFEVEDDRGYLSARESSNSDEIEIRSGSFGAESARDNAIFLGVGVDIWGDIIPSAVFIPEPDTTYAIKPRAHFTIVQGGFGSGTLISPERVRRQGGSQIDLSQRPRCVARPYSKWTIPAEQLDRSMSKN